MQSRAVFFTREVIIFLPFFSTNQRMAITMTPVRKASQPKP